MREINCPKCGRLLMVPEESAGTDCECPACASVFVAEERRKDTPQSGNNSTAFAAGLPPNEAPSATAPGREPTLAAWHAKRYHILAAVVIFGAACVYFLANLENRTMPYEPKVISPTCELATLGGGCFWCLEGAFEQVNGVERVEAGYSGGPGKNPTYKEVCTGTTDHAEVVQVAFDPKVISYREILEIFFAIHDPTTLNRQGNDVGTQYRSVIFYHSPEQKQTAEKLIAEFKEQKLWGRPIVTQVQPLDVFYRAEDYHQGYFRANPGQGYCQAIIAPKVAKLRQHYAAKLKKP